MATRRGLFGFLTVPLWPWTAQASSTDTITINPRDLWTSDIVCAWLQIAVDNENDDMKEPPFYPDHLHVVYFSEILSLDHNGLIDLLVEVWPEKRMGAYSHIGWIANSLATRIDRGYLALHLNENKLYHPVYSAEVNEAAHTKVFPLVRDLLNKYVPV